jgi:uncharacterized membrane protein
MKYFIAFTLFFLTNCLAPASISAATNPINVAAHSATFTPKKLTFKQKLLLKITKKDGKKMSTAQILFLIGTVLILLGIVLMFVGANKHAQRQAQLTNPNSVLAINFDGLAEGFLGGGSFLLGCIALVIGYNSKKRKAKPTSE